jgi:recombination protein RecA
METSSHPLSPSLSSRLRRAAALEPGNSRGETLPGWCLADLAGRLVELSASRSSCSLTLASLLVAEAQSREGLAAWISGTSDTFFPPDLAANGVDLSTLPVVRVPGALPAGRAADWLLRTGAFSLLVLDLGRDPALPGAVQARLAQLARRHATAVLFLTCKDALSPSLGSLISLRAEAQRRPLAEARRLPPGTGARGFICSLRVLKDKRRSPGWKHAEVCGGPPGLC